MLAYLKLARNTDVPTPNNIFVTAKSLYSEQYESVAGPFDSLENANEFYSYLQSAIFTFYSTFYTAQEEK